MSNQNSAQAQIIARAMKDDAFRQELLANPKAALERELKITIPDDVVIHVYEDTPTTIHLALPLKTSSGEPQELSDAELDAIAGGGGVPRSVGFFTLGGPDLDNYACSY